MYARTTIVLIESYRKEKGRALLKLSRRFFHKTMETAKTI